MAGHNWRIDYTALHKVFLTDGRGAYVEDHEKVSYFRNPREAKGKYKQLVKQKNIVCGELFFKNHSVEHFYDNKRMIRT
jgi:hypothetical protein